MPRADVWSRETSGGRAHEVAEHAPNAWGLYDMNGNAMQWCADAWTETLAPGTVSDPYVAGDPATDRFVVRGGAWWLGADQCTSGWRSMNPASANGYRGFRIVLGPVLKGG